MKRNKIIAITILVAVIIVGVILAVVFGRDVYKRQGKGYTLDEDVKEVKMVVEGAVSAKAALELAKKYNVDMPIVEAVNEVLFDNKPAEEAMWELMEREQTNEFHDLEWR